MPRLAWDRLLETYCRRDASVMLFVPGSPPILHIGQDWRPLQVPPLEAADVVEMAAERMSPAPDGEAAGYAYSDFWYGDVAYFRAMAFGHPETRLLVVSRTQPDRPPSRNPPSPNGDRNPPAPAGGASP